MEAVLFNVKSDCYLTLLNIILKSFVFYAEDLLKTSICLKKGDMYGNLLGFMLCCILVFTDVVDNYDANAADDCENTVRKIQIDLSKLHIMMHVQQATFENNEAKGEIAHD